MSNDICEWEAEHKIRYLQELQRKEWSKRILDVFMPQLSELAVNNKLFMNYLANFMDKPTDDNYTSLYNILPPQLQEELKKIQPKQILPDCEY